jgi:4-amino-4-deoxy-L-arabinose transferase-like glycosyltransferase
VTTTADDDTDLRQYDERPAAPPAATQGRLRGLFTGNPDDPRWARPGLLALLAATALLYLWNLSASGYANSFYAAAVQAGSVSWKAMFFGSFDAANAITVDKPPASLWVMDLSARVFGFSSWSLLAPQALEGVASVALVYATVRRVASPAAALLAGAVLALTPVATLMFRYDNPDALLVLLLVGAAYATLRAVEVASTRWLALAGALIGLGFLTKMLQAVVVVPVLAGVYLLAAPTGLGRRLRQLVVAGLALVASAGWWVAIVSLIPAGSRPYIGGSQTNSVLELTFGYNGLGRLTGNETGSVGGGMGAAAGGSRWGSTGLLRMFNSEMGGQISWLIPAALLLLVGGLWLGRRGARTDLTRVALLLWGGWLLLTGVVFSLAKGIIHPYYTVALAPAIAALVGIGSVQLWERRSQWPVRVVLAGAVAVTAGWAYVLLQRSPTWHPEVRAVVVLAGLVAVAGILASPYVPRPITAAVAAVALLAALAGPAAASVQTAATAHGGAIPSAGPAVAGARGGPGGLGGQPGLRGQRAFGRPPGNGGTGGAAPGMPPGGTLRQRGGQGGLGGLLDSATPSSALVTALTTNAERYTWIAATVGANSAAGVQLATGEPILAIGGFNGSDPAPTLAQFEQYVAAGQVHWFLSGGRGMGGQGGGSSASSEIRAWVSSTFTATTIGGVTVYDLTHPITGAAGGTTA